MEKIEKYIDRFFSKTKKNIRYTLKSDEMSIFMNKIMAMLRVTVRHYLKC